MTIELYPTNLRSQALGFCSMIARIFGVVVPYVTNLALFWKPLPMLVLALPSLLAAVSAYFLPETKGKELPQNMKDTSEEKQSLLNSFHEDKNKTLMKKKKKSFT